MLRPGRLLPLLLLVACARLTAGSHAYAASGWWIPPVATSWQWQLTGPIDVAADVAMYDLDLVDTTAATVAGLHARGRHAVCYMSAGTWERWRPDASRFAPDLLGAIVSGWADERWLDIRRIDVLGPIVEARLDACARKGFDGVEPDNVDAYANRSGFPLTAADQLRYNRWLAQAAHARGLSVGLKNDLGQVRDLAAAFDWALNEQCVEFKECDRLQPFTAAGKAVFHVEYRVPASAFCAEAVALRFNSMRQHLALDAYREACPAPRPAPPTSLRMVK